MTTSRQFVRSLCLGLLLSLVLLGAAEEGGATMKLGGTPAKENVGRRGRVVSMADVHGDYGRAASILRSMGIMDENQRWVGGSTTLVQTGDLVDRGQSSEKVLKLFSSLAQQAAKDGGQVVNLMGNHEMMLLEGHTRYVDPRDTYPEGGGFEAAWGRDGWARKDVLKRFRPLAVVGDTLYVHGGLEPHLAPDAFGAEEETAAAPLSSFAQLEPTSSSSSSLAKHQFLRTRAGSLSQFLKKESWTGDEGPFWMRSFAEDEEAEVCPRLAATLKVAGARRMVVGHTMQEDHKVASRCGGRLILADTVISRGYVLEGLPDYETRSKPEHYPGMSVVEIGEDGNAFAVYTPQMTRVPLDLKVPSLRGKATL